MNILQVLNGEGEPLGLFASKDVDASVAEDIVENLEEQGHSFRDIEEALNEVGFERVFATEVNTNF